MQTKNDGGAAFPVPASDMQGTGISMRDYFAAKALTGLCTTGFPVDPDALADSAYVIADAMISARQNRS